MARGIVRSTHLGRDGRGGWHRGGRTGFVLGVWGSEEPTNLRGERGVVSGESSSRDFFFERRPRGGWNRERTVFVRPPIPHRRGVTILFSTFSLLPPSPPPGGSPPYGEDRPPLVGVPEGADMGCRLRALCGGATDRVPRRERPSARARPTRYHVGHDQIDPHGSCAATALPVVAARTPGRDRKSKSVIVTSWNA